MSRHFLFVTASARDGGNSLTMARRAADHLPEGASQAWIDLNTNPMPLFEDLRHAEPGYGPVAPSVQPILDATLAATDIVLVAPLYWYGIPAAAKLYIDHWSHWLRLEGVDFRARMGDKALWLIMAYASANDDQIRPATEQCRFSIEFFGGTWKGALLGKASMPGQIAGDADAMARAETFFTT